jgi:hypothetical protein
MLALPTCCVPGDDGWRFTGVSRKKAATDRAATAVIE